MKLILMSTIALLIFAAPVFSELTVTDLEKIRSIVKESEDRLKEDLKASEERLREDLKASEKRLKEDIGTSERRLMQHVADKFGEVDKRLNIIFGFVIALITLIVVVVGVPQIIMAWRGKEDRTQKEQIQELRQEIEALKQQRT
jgi:hypothetical protein